MADSIHYIPNGYCPLFFCIHKSGRIIENPPTLFIYTKKWVHFVRFRTQMHFPRDSILKIKEDFPQNQGLSSHLFHIEQKVGKSQAIPPTFFIYKRKWAVFSKPAHKLYI